MRTYESTNIWDTPTDPLAKAKVVLGFYLGELARESNLDWDWRNQDEINETVDSIVEAVTQKIVKGLQ